MYFTIFMNLIFIIDLTRPSFMCYIHNVEFNIWNKGEDMNQDISKEELVDMTGIADILGLKYHTARKYILKDKTLNIVMFGTKKLWLKSEIMDFKNKHLLSFPLLVTA